MRVPFEEKTFNYCYNCGWGECGVHEYSLSFTLALQLIKERAGDDAAEQWAKSKDEHYEFRDDYYMVSEDMFDEEHWKGSEDY